MADAFQKKQTQFRNGRLELTNGAFLGALGLPNGGENGLGKRFRWKYAGGR
ncbi:hypothetical protein [Spirosoma aerophilum]